MRPGCPAVVLERWARGLRTQRLKTVPHDPSVSMSLRAADCPPATERSAHAGTARHLAHVRRLTGNRGRSHIAGSSAASGPSAALAPLEISGSRTMRKPNGLRSLSAVHRRHMEQLPAPLEPPSMNTGAAALFSLDGNRAGAGHHEGLDVVSRPYGHGRCARPPRCPTGAHLCRSR